MSSRRIPPADMPYWPRGLSAEMAAAYVGVSVGKFLAEVDAKLWPKPVRRGGRLVWDRAALDARFDEISGLAHPARTGEMIKRAKSWAQSRSRT